MFGILCILIIKDQWKFVRAPVLRKYSDALDDMVGGHHGSVAIGRKYLLHVRFVCKCFVAILAWDRFCRFDRFFRFLCRLVLEFVVLLHV
jgi:hypothetical protein